MPLFRTKDGLDTTADDNGNKLSLTDALRKVEQADAPEFRAESAARAEADPTVDAINRGRVAARQVVDQAVENNLPVVPNGALRQALHTGEVPIISANMPRPEEQGPAELMAPSAVPTAGPEHQDVA
jgi:hypothetical protein